jgi:feruloyl esterase
MGMKCLPGYGVLIALFTCFVPCALQGQSCESLSKLTSAIVLISGAKTVTSKSLTPAGTTTAFGSVPNFCRIEVNLKPTPDSDIHAEIWLPVSGWNGKLLAVGSAGWGGDINYEDMAEALRRGYATSATDDGHSGRGASFIAGHPEKFIDFAYRAEHQMTIEAKALIKAFYHRDALYSYWNGCSGGGREGLLQAHRYPDEFDGIIAGDPADIRRNSWALWLATKSFADPNDYIPPGKYPMIHRFVVDACDANDGLKDGLIAEPESCRVDFNDLKCKGSDAADCLTIRQVQTAQTMLSPARTSDGKVIFPNLEPGTELRWGRLAGGPQPADLFLDEFRYVVYQDARWDWRAFDLERDSAKAHAVDSGVDELDPHLRAFAKHGGKLLLYHGWADQQVAPGASIEFYESVINHSENPAQASNWIRLFMAPGMAHCAGGEGPNAFDPIRPMEQWVEEGKAPAQIIAAHSTGSRVDRTRPLCPYPQVAHYKGSGSIDAAENFSCVAPR